jgi:hypothetical protein
MEKCKVSFCKNEKASGYRGYCRKHYDQIWKYGEIKKRIRTDKNKIKEVGSVCFMDLYDKNNSKVAVTKFNKRFLNKVSKYKWGFDKKNGYVFGSINNKKVFLHRFIKSNQLVKGKVVDHINHDKLDNRLNNLRVVDYSVNNFNRKGVTGVSWHKNHKKWQVCLSFRGKRHYFGLYKEKEEAIKVSKHYKNLIKDMSEKFNIEKKREEVEKKFKEFEEKSNEYRAALAEIETEKTRLQGEYRLLQEMEPKEEKKK